MFSLNSWKGRNFTEICFSPFHSTWCWAQF